MKYFEWLGCLQCDICLLAVSVWDVPAAMSCLHRFCSACWERYLTVRIQEGDAHHILCPATACHILVPPELIEKLVSPEVARKYLQFDIKVLVPHSAVSFSLSFVKNMRTIQFIRI